MGARKKGTLISDTRGLTSAEWLIIGALLLLGAGATFHLVLGAVDPKGAQVAGIIATGEGSVGTGGLGGVGGPGGAPGAGAGGAAAEQAQQSGVFGAVGRFFGDMVRGAFYGDFNDKESWGATLGQTLIGFVPIAGQIGDIRDTASAIKDVYDGEEGAWKNLGLAAIGWVPGLGDAGKGLLRGGDTVLRASLKHADEAVGAVAGARRGLKVLGEGSFSIAYRDGDHVIKEIKPTIFGAPVDAASRKQLAERMAEFTNDAAEGVGGGLVPRIEVVGDGVLRQPYVGGSTLDELRTTNFQAFERAVEQKNAAMNRAAKGFGFDSYSEVGTTPDGWTVRIDDNSANFRFDAQGNMTSWFDPVVVLPPTPPN